MNLIYSENKKIILGLASMLGLFAIWIIILIIVASIGNDILIGVFFVIMMLSSIVANIYIAYKLLSIPCELHFGKDLEIKFLRKSIFYNLDYLIFSKSDIIQVEESNSKGIFFYKIHTKTGSFNLSSKSQFKSDTELLKAFENFMK